MLEHKLTMQRHGCSNYSELCTRMLDIAEPYHRETDYLHPHGRWQTLRELLAAERNLADSGKSDGSLAKFTAQKAFMNLTKETQSFLALEKITTHAQAIGLLEKAEEELIYAENSTKQVREILTDRKLTQKEAKAYKKFQEIEDLLPEKIEQLKNACFYLWENSQEKDKDHKGQIELERQAKWHLKALFQDKGMEL